MRIAGYILRHRGTVCLIVILLIAQAFCELALPKYTSDIVDVGIQQSGVEHVAVEEMSQSTYDDLKALLSPEDEALLVASYDSTESGTYRLNGAGRAQRDQLDRILAAPLVRIAEEREQTIDSFAQMEQAYEEDAKSQEKVLSLRDTEQERGEDGSALLDQRALSAALREYKALGYDLSSMQTAYLLRVGGAMALLAGGAMVFSILIGLLASRTGARIGHDLRRDLFKRVVAFSEREIGRFSAASLITRGTNDIQLIQNVSIMFLRMVLYAPILALGGIVMVMLTDASLGWIIVFAIVAVFVVMIILFRLTMPQFKIMQKLIDRVNLRAREMLSGLFVIRAFDREDFEEARFEEASYDLMSTQLFTNRAMAFMMPTMMLIMNASSVAIVWFGGLYVGVGTLQTGDLIAYITYAMVIIMGFLMMGMISIMLPRANVAAERVAEVIACEPSIHDPSPVTSSVTTEGSAPQDSGAKISFEHVMFRYDDGSEYALEDISFTAYPGETVAIIGPTGSGKSTILKLIERFYDVDGGSIKMDDVDVRDVPQSRLRSTLGYVPQTAFLFSGTIASNVAYSDESMDAGRIQWALDIAQASQFVADKPEGMDFEVSQGGTNVSGGQRQRLAIARALAREARAYLFDDSFSALDAKTDAKLRLQLHEQLMDATCFIVSQRVSTVMGADRILVLENGRLVGNGTHEQLLSDCLSYREIARSQLSSTELARAGDER